MTIQDTLWGDERYHLVVTSYKSKIVRDHGVVMVCVSMLNRDNGHITVELLTADRWNNFYPPMRQGLIDTLGNTVQKMDLLCSGENLDNDPRGHWCTLTSDRMTSKAKDDDE